MSDTADKKSEGTKLFIGGLSWDTSDVGFSNFFSRFGEVVDAVVMRDRMTGASRGFGFVTFANSMSAEKVLSAPDLTLDGKTVDPKLAVPRTSMPPRARGPGSPVTGGAAPSPIGRTKKIFVGGLAPETDTNDFRAYFKNFGHVEDAIIMMDHATHRSRGFGFVTFDNEEAVEKVMENRTHVISSKSVECKRAVPKTQMRVPGGRGGRGGWEGPQAAGWGGPAGFRGGFDGGFGAAAGYGGFGAAAGYGMDRGYGAAAGWGAGGAAGYGGRVGGAIGGYGNQQGAGGAGSQGAGNGPYGGGYTGARGQGGQGGQLGYGGQSSQPAYPAGYQQPVMEGGQASNGIGRSPGYGGYGGMGYDQQQQGSYGGQGEGGLFVS